VAVDPKVRAEFEVLLGSHVNLRSRAMFGGLGFYADEWFFALADDEVLYFKVDEANQADYEAAGTGPFVPWPGAAPMGYWEVPKRVLEDPDELKIWIDKAVGVAERSKRPRKKARPR
jgi:DNA transformation protein and related proteins